VSLRARQQFASAANVPVSTDKDPQREVQALLGPVLAVGGVGTLAWWDSSAKCAGSGGTGAWRHDCASLELCELAEGDEEPQRLSGVSAICPKRQLLAAVVNQP
jgi:hypothetical protein